MKNIWKKKYKEEKNKEEKNKEEKSEKMINHKQLVKITKMNLFFCEDEEIDNKETLGNKINEYVQNFVNNKFIPYKFPTKIKKSKTKGGWVVRISYSSKCCCWKYNYNKN